MTSEAMRTSQPPPEGSKKPLLVGARPPAALLKPIEEWGEEEERLFETWTAVLYDQMRRAESKIGSACSSSKGT